MNAKNSSSVLISLVILGVFLIFVAIVMLLNNQKVNKFPPYQSIGYSEQTSSDEKVRYILLDIQLGATANYYRKYQDEDSNIRQALTLWDQGVRIVNIYQFDRVEIDNGGWQVTYGGTDKIVVGSDIVLTEDIGATGNDEARIRYILADAQLGGVIDYYRQYTSEASVKKAVKLWDQGVRVVNIGDFQRIIVANAGWQVVYLGSTRAINGMDVVLTTDNISGQSSSNQMGSCDNNSGETRILYILADIQLSGNRGYYAELADPYALEAVHRWDSGTTVQNISAFERKIIDGKGWQIVYAGTDTTICGNDVIMTTSSSNRAMTFCNNRYWPIVEGAKWEYANGYYFIVNKVNGDGIGSTASLSTPTGEMNLTCLADGIHNQDFLLLPPEQEIEIAKSQNREIRIDFTPDYIFVLGNDIYQKTVPAGTYDVVRIIIATPYSGYSYLDIWYGKDVGIIEFDQSQDESQYVLYNLISYYIP